MSFFRKPWFVALLVALAIGVVAYQILEPGWRRARLYRTPPVAPGSEQDRLKPELHTQERMKAELQAPETQAKEKEAGPKVDTNFVRAHFGDWLKSATNDPFALMAKLKPESSEPSPVSKWQLKAIWHQTGRNSSICGRHWRCSRETII